LVLSSLDNTQWPEAMKRILSIAVLLWLLYFQTFSQSSISPNLSIDAGKVLLEKGKLDAELLGEIVATKKDEVKRQLVKNLLSKQFKNSNLVIKSFILGNFDLIFEKSSPSTKRKELLVRSSELALTIGFAEYYLQDLSKRMDKYMYQELDQSFKWDDSTVGHSVDEREVEFLLEYMRNLDLKSRAPFYLTYFGGYKGSKEDSTRMIAKIDGHRQALKKIPKLSDKIRFEEDMKFYKKLSLPEKIYMSIMYYNIKGFSKYNPNSLGDMYKKIGELNYEDFRKLEYLKYGDAEIEKKYLTKPKFLIDFKNTNDISDEAEGDFPSPNHLFIDLVQEVLEGNELVREFGFFQKSNSKKLTSLYQKRAEEAPNTTGEFFEPMKSILDFKIGTLLQYYELIQRLINLFDGIGNDQIATDSLATRFARGKDILENNKILKTVAEIKKVAINTKATKLLPDNQRELIESLILNLNDKVTDRKELNNYINYFEKLILPKFISYSFDNKHFKELTEECNQLSLQMKDLGVYRVIYEYFGFDFDGKSVTENKQISETLSSEAYYINLLRHMANLDQATTYDAIFKFLANLGDISSSKPVGIIINTLVNYLDKYASVDEEKNQVDIDLGGAAAEIYERYQANASGNLSIHFTVGLNTAAPWFGKNEIDFLIDSEGNSPSNASFVSEKIGLKWRLFNFNQRYMEGVRTEKPLLNDIHLLSYVSGLLYQIDALNSVEGFKNTTLGIGAGVTFFNNLDFNISYAGVVGDLLNKNYLNIGFDIQITEYLNELSKKKKSKKAQ
jgi:hypothetical protein